MTSPTSGDPFAGRFADRVESLVVSEIRALFSVASRPEVVSLAGGMPATDALDFQELASTAAAVIRRRGHEAFQYGSGQGHPELREHLAAVMALEGVPAAADSVVVTTGGQQAIDLVAKLLLNPGSVVLTEAPTYVGALSAFRALQAHVVHLPMDAAGVTPDGLREVVEHLRQAGRPPAFLYLVPNYQNPLGTSVPEDRRDALAEVAEALDLIIVEDNPYGLLSFDGSTRKSFLERCPERTIYVGTLSKTLAAGLRTGWLCAPAHVRDRIVQLREAADLCPSNVTQLVTAEWFEQCPWQEQVDRFRSLYARKADVTLRALSDARLDGCSWTVPRGGFYIWLALPPELDAQSLLARSLRNRVAFVPGTAFFADGRGRTHLRLCYSHPTPERLRVGVGALAAAIKAEQETARAVMGRPLSAGPSSTSLPSGRVALRVHDPRVVDATEGLYE